MFKLTSQVTLDSFGAVKITSQQTAITVSVCRIQDYIISVAHHLQVIAPVSLASALYSIPSSVTPLKLESRYFLLAVVVIMAVVQVLFIIPNITWWCEVLEACTRCTKIWLLRQHYDVKQRFKRNTRNEAADQEAGNLGSAHAMTTAGSNV